MNYIGMTQTVYLKDLEFGYPQTLIVTGVNVPAYELQFQNIDDPTWYTFPTSADGGALLLESAAGASSPGATMLTFLCVSTAMRIVFDSAPVSNCYISIVGTANANF